MARRKKIHTGKIVVSFVLGTRRLYDFVDNNPMCEFHPSEFTNDPFRIAQNDRVVAINSALQVDLTGQVCADSLGTYFYSGIGGQVDFIRGASRSHQGRPIIALPSTAGGGKVSRIVPTLTPWRRCGYKPGRRALRGHRIWYCRFARQDHTRTRHGIDSYRTSGSP